MAEPRYTRSEQRLRMKDWDAMAARAREEWRKGRATVLLSYKEYLDLIARKRKAED